jgi:hypothetical protein
MLLNLESVWSDGLTTLAIGAVLVSMVFLAACAVGGLCRDAQDPEQRNAA